MLLAVILQFSVANTEIFAQNGSPLDSFTGFENKGKVYLNWVISLGNTCSGIKILRSADRVNYTQVGVIDGVCGSVSTRESYSFIDEKPIKNSVNYYRLELGGSGASDIVSLEVIDTGNGINQIRPNPIETESKIYFENDSKVRHQLVVSALEGTAVVFSIFTHENFFQINTISLPSGIYVFSIFEPNNLLKTSGKIVVLH